MPLMRKYGNKCFNTKVHILKGHCNRILHIPGVSYGLTQDLLRFWKKCGFLPAYLRQTANDLTGEHSGIMLRLVQHQNEDESSEHSQWLSAFGADFKRRFVNLLGFDFRKFSPGNFSFTLISPTVGFILFAKFSKLFTVPLVFVSF